MSLIYKNKSKYKLMVGPCPKLVTYDILSFHVILLTGFNLMIALIVWLRSVHFSSKLTAPGLRDIFSKLVATPLRNYFIKNLLQLTFSFHFFFIKELFMF